MSRAPNPPYIAVHPLCQVGSGKQKVQGLKEDHRRAGLVYYCQLLTRWGGDEAGATSAGEAEGPHEMTWWAEFS